MYGRKSGRRYSIRKKKKERERARRQSLTLGYDESNEEWLESAGECQNCWNVIFYEKEEGKRVRESYKNRERERTRGER